MIADGAAVFKRAVALQLKRIKSFKFKRTLNEFDLTALPRQIGTDLERGLVYRQSYANLNLGGLCLGVITRLAPAAPSELNEMQTSGGPEGPFADVRLRFTWGRSGGAALAAAGVTVSILTRRARGAAKTKNFPQLSRD
jgi:hypothetical protein